MRKILAAFAIVAVAAFASTGIGHAVEMASGNCGLGFFDQNAPIGGIYWLSPKAGLAVGVGFAKPDEGDTELDLTVGIPINLLQTERANFQFRPRVFYASNGGGPDVDFLAAGADLAAEVFITDHFSLLAGHGFEMRRTTPSEGDAHTDMGTRVIQSTSVGFFFYIQH